MENTTSRTRWWKLAVLLIIIPALVFGGRALLRSEWMRGLVLEKLREVVSKAGGPLYSLKIGKVDIDPIGGDLAILDLSLEPDTALLDSLRHGRGRFVLNARAGRIAVSGLSYWRLLLKDEVRIASATVYTPVVRYTYASHRDAQVRTSAEDRQTQETPDLLSIGELLVTEASGTAVDLTERAPELSIGRMDARAHEVHIRLPKLGDPLEWVVGTAQVDIQHVAAELPPLYDLSIAHIGLLHPEGLASIDSLRYTPHVDRKTTHKYLREMTTIYALDVKSIALARVDLYRAFAEQQVEMGSLTVDGAFFDVFLDKSMPDALSHFMPLPVSALRNVPFGLRVDTLRLMNTDMTYSERFEVGNGYGSMRLTGIGATIMNVSNDTLLALADSSMRGTVDAKLFDAGVLHGEYAAPLASTKDAFTLDVTVRDMPLSAANNMSENLILLRADSGWIGSLKLHMSANNDSAMGAFTLKYSDAWLQILDEDGGKRRLLTQLANTAVHHDSKDRPADDRTMLLRIGRKKDRSLFNFIWCYTREGLTRTLLPGVLADIQGAIMRQKERARNAEQRQRKRAARKGG